MHMSGECSVMWCAVLIVLWRRGSPWRSGAGYFPRSPGRRGRCAGQGAGEDRGLEEDGEGQVEVEREIGEDQREPHMCNMAWMTDSMNLSQCLWHIIIKTERRLTARSSVEHVRRHVPSSKFRNVSVVLTTFTAFTALLHVLDVSQQNSHVTKQLHSKWLVFVTPSSELLFASRTHGSTFMTCMIISLVSMSATFCFWCQHVFDLDLGTTIQQWSQIINHLDDHPQSLLHTLRVRPHQLHLNLALKIFTCATHDPGIFRLTIRDSEPRISTLRATDPWSCLSAPRNHSTGQRRCQIRPCSSAQARYMSGRSKSPIDSRSWPSCRRQHRHPDQHIAQSSILPWPSIRSVKGLWIAKVQYSSFCGCAMDLENGGSVLMEDDDQDRGVKIMVKR